MKHRTSSPLYPQSNGMAEKSVQTMKTLIKKAIHDKRDQYIALLDYQNTPLSDSLGSPSQRLMRRRTRNLIPTVDSYSDPKLSVSLLYTGNCKNVKINRIHITMNHMKPFSKLKEGKEIFVHLRSGWVCNTQLN